MAYFEWSDALSVSVGEIDSQHKMLVSMVNSLRDAMLNGKGRDVQKVTIEDMVDYATVHFATEEKYMKAFAYPEYAPHKKEHDAFTAKALELRGRVQKAGFVLTMEILDFLRNWLKNHIQVTDKRYQGCFREHGLR
jgi:hemerythrin